MGLYDLETNEARLHTLGSVTVKDNCFAENAYYGLYNKRTDMTVDATLNWWGDPSGPRPLGTGDYAYDAPTNLAVSPWLVYDPTLAPPEVTLNVPPTFEVMLAMAAEVTSEVAIDRVQFYWDHDGQSTLLGTVEEAPYALEWTPRVQLGVDGYSPNAFGVRVIRAVAIDQKGRSGIDTKSTEQEPALLRPVADAINDFFDLDRELGQAVDWLGGVPRDQHAGTDYDCPDGTEVLSCRAGEVAGLEADFPNIPTSYVSAGNFVKLSHSSLDDGKVYYTKYEHLQSVCVTLCDAEGHPTQVEGGQKIGLSGRSGYCLPPEAGWHLHLGVLDEAEVALCPYDAGFMQGPPQ